MGITSAALRQPREKWSCKTLQFIPHHHEALTINYDKIILSRIHISNIHMISIYPKYIMN